MPKPKPIVREVDASRIEAVFTDIRNFTGMDGGPSAIFSKFQNDHLLIGVNEKRYHVWEARDSTPATCGESVGGLYSMDQLFNLSIKRPEPVIQDLLYEGELMLLAGRPKVGKSRLLHQMAVSLSSGAPFLGMSMPRARRVLLVDLENKPWAIKERLSRMAGEQPSANVFVWCSDTLADSAIEFSAHGTEELERLLNHTRADVLIIDPWRLWLGRDENNAEEVVRGLKALTALRRNRPALAIIVIHHVRKERFESPAKLMKDPSLWVENISGHYALVGHVDACYGLERQEQDGEEVVIFGGIARNVETRTVLLNDDPESLRFEVVTTEDAAKMAMTAKEWDLWEKAKRKKQFTWSSFLADAGTTNKKRVSSMLKKAEAHNLIEKVDQKYTVLGAK